MKPCKNCGAYLASFVLSCYALWSAYRSYWEPALAWINLNAGLAGWVQAIGSIAAVVGTWWATKHQLSVGELMRKRTIAARDAELNLACLKVVATAHRILKKYHEECANHTYFRRIPDLSRAEAMVETARTLLNKDLPGQTLVEMINCTTALEILISLMKTNEVNQSFDAVKMLQLFHARDLGRQARWKIRRCFLDARALMKLLA